MAEPLVFLVGAGPGNPGLLTLRGLECLQKADLVLYDRLVPARLLDYAPPAAEKICVTELAEHHVQRQVPVQERMIEAARQGKRVVRLKGGDPFVFGRGGEEAEALRQAGIAFEVVPGVTAALGAAAFAGIPLTHRSLASAVAFVTGHEDPDKPESHLDWAALAGFPGTLVIYMGLARLEVVVENLLAHGKAADTPAAAVHLATTGQQRTITASLKDLPAAAERAGILSPAVTIIGPVVALREHLNWFEKLPLFGKRILVTRPRQQAAELVQRLEQFGAVALSLSAVEIREPADWRPVDQAIARLSSYHWLVFTSVNGVHSFLNRLLKQGRDLRALGALKVAAIGSQTAAALRAYHLEPDLVPARFQSEHLAAALKEQLRPGQRVLLARADRGRELLREELARVAEVEQVAVYSQVDVIEPGPCLLEALARREIDYVTVTSSNIARAFVRFLDEDCKQALASGQVKVVSISPVTSAAVRELGFPVAAEADEATAEGVVRALIALAMEGETRASDSS
jgi:uroporphyrinogen III methyltransferase/synthase